MKINPKQQSDAIRITYAAMHENTAGIFAAPANGVQADPVQAVGQAVGRADPVRAVDFAVMLEMATTTDEQWADPSHGLSFLWRGPPESQDEE